MQCNLAPNEAESLRCVKIGCEVVFLFLPFPVMNSGL